MVISQISDVYLGALRGRHWAMALICDAKEAAGEGKSGLVETGLTEQAAMALNWPNEHTESGINLM